MIKPKICIMPLGQTPRDDWAGPIQEILGDSVEVIQRGCLDGLSYEEIVALDERPDDHMLATALASAGGKRVGFAKRHVLDRVPGHLRDLEEEGVDFVTVCCSEPWPEFEFKGMFIEVFSLMYSLVKGLKIKGPGTVFYHVASQKQATIDRWEGVDNLTFTYLEPGHTDEQLEEIMKQVEASGAKFAVLDCFGFSVEQKSYMQERLGIPVILPMTCLANSLREVLTKV